MKYITKEERELNEKRDLYSKRRLLDIIDEIGDEIFYLLNSSDNLFDFKKKLDSLIVSTEEGNRVYDIVRRLVLRICDLQRNLEKIECDTLSRLYIESDMSQKEIADELECDVYKVRDYIFKCNLYKGKSEREKYNIPPGELKELLNKNMSKKSIAEHFGCSVRCINKRIRKYEHNIWGDKNDGG